MTKHFARQLRRTAFNVWLPLATGYGVTLIGVWRDWPSWGRILVTAIVVLWYATRGRQARDQWRPYHGASLRTWLAFLFEHFFKPTFWLALFVGAALAQPAPDRNILDRYASIGAMSKEDRRVRGEQEFLNAGTFFLCCGFAYLYFAYGGVERFTHVRGPILLSINEAKAKIAKLRAPDDPGIYWAGLRLPSFMQRYHHLVVGITGGGKSTLLNAELQSVFVNHARRPQGPLRALIYDAKQDAVSMLAGMPLPGPLVIFNPFDQRCLAWDIAKDATDFGVISQFAKIFVPEFNESQRYFSDAARDLLDGIMRSFSEMTPGVWTLRDLVIAMQTKESMVAVWQRSPYTRALIPLYCHPASTFASVRSTLATRLRPLEQVAACWARAAHRISLNDWVRSNSVLVLGADDSRRAALDPINHVVFQRIAELLLAKPDNLVDRTWIQLDEAREFGKVPGLNSLLIRGRSKGCTLQLGFQDLSGYQAVLGDKLADEIVSQASIKTFLRIASVTTAKWASQQFGDFERYERMNSSSTTGGKTTSSWSEQLVKRELILPSEFQSLPLGDYSRGFEAFNILPEIGCCRSFLSPERLRELLPPNAAFANVVLRPPEHFKLQPWTKADLIRLKLPLGLLNLTTPKPAKLRRVP